MSSSKSGQVNTAFQSSPELLLRLYYLYSHLLYRWFAPLLIGAQQTLSKYGIDEKNVDIFYAPGAFEIPLLAKKLAKSGKYHGIVALGAVINGETPHFDFVCSECARGVADVSYQYEVPTKK
jgi:6,7-dimethyl-8-ribityllumazine synthase